MYEVVGNYTLLQPLGEGGMGTVYLAQHQHLQYYAVVKSLHPNYAQNEALRQRFYAEAQVMSQISHPAIVRLYDFVIQGGVPYLIMEYVQGTPLDKVIANRGSLSPEECYQIMGPIWDALYYLHSLKIIHRDIKPSNIMVLPEGGAKLIDFGIAKALDSDYKLTQTGMQVGTVLYMAPEQIQGVPVSPATDLYALGLVAYESLFGRFPWDWQGKTQFQLYQTLLTEAPPMPGWAPDTWKAFFDKALAKNPADRYASAYEMKAAFEGLILGINSHATLAQQDTPSSDSLMLLPEAEQTLSPASNSLPAPIASNPQITLPEASQDQKTSLIAIPLLIILLVIGIAGFLAFRKYQISKRRKEVKSQIEALVASYNAANEAALKNEIKSFIKKTYPNATISEISFYEASLSELSPEELDDYHEGYLLAIHGGIPAVVQFSYKEIQEVVEERECSYETGFLFWRETHYGSQKWAYEVITPYKCEARITIPCTWRLQKEGLVERGVEKEVIEYDARNCAAQTSYRGREWPISGCE